MVCELDIGLPDGRRLHVYDSGERADLALLWHHGSPQTGTPPEPLWRAAAERGVRWVSYDRPGYGGSSRRPERTVADAALDAAAIADALGLTRFATIAASGGGPHAMACAALMPERVVGVVSAAGLAPHDADGLDWFAGMAAAGAAELLAAEAGAAALEHHLATTQFDPAVFTAPDHEALAGAWACLGAIASLGMAHGPGGLVDDDRAFVRSWGFDPASIAAPMLLLHGDGDRVVPEAHGRWLAGRCPTAELRLQRGAGHISVMTHLADSIDWLAGLPAETASP